MACPRPFKPRPGPLAALAVIVALAPALAAMAAPFHLAPAFTGQYRAGTGADAAFVHVDDQWRGSTVLWNEATRSFGSGTAIGNYAWGTGIWGLSDWSTVMAMQAGQAPLLSSWRGLVGSINFGNQAYNDAYAARWGAAQALPGATAENNWAAAFSGYIRITEAGLYNFSVLYDDGFSFRLSGAGGAGLTLGTDYINPRDRVGFGDDLALDPGLYPFSLAAYNRAEAGVVDLRWQRVGGETGWTLIPAENLVGAAAVAAMPEPSALLLLAGGLALLAAWRRAVPATRRSAPAAPVDACRRAQGSGRHSAAAGHGESFGQPLRAPGARA